MKEEKHCITATQNSDQERKEISQFYLFSYSVYYLLLEQKLSTSFDLRFSLDVSIWSSLCEDSPSGTLPGSDKTAGDGRGLKTQGTGQDSFVQVV